MSPNSRRIALQRTARLVDLATVSLTFFAAMAISAGAFTWPTLAYLFGIRIALVNLVLFAGFLGLCAAIFSACGFYRSHRMSHWTRRVREIVLAVTVITAILLLAREPLAFTFATNTFVMVFWALTVSFFALCYMIGQQFLYYARSRGRNLRNVVIVGEGKDAAALAERIQGEITLGYRVVRVINAKEIVS